jgi:cytochrome c biogenesis protein CcmG/thiol:disulfide interchange protein DsbE
MKTGLVPLLAGGLFIGLGLAFLVLLPGSSIRSAPEIGKPLPNFELNNLAGESFRLEQFRGQPVLINFWATWCPPCKDELPLLNDYFQNFKNKMAFVGIDAQEDPKTVTDFMDMYKIDFPILLDPGGVTIRDYLIRGFPTTFFVDAQGKLVAIHIGGLKEADLKDYLMQTGVIQ